MNNVNIRGVNVDLDAPDLAKAKSLTALKKLDIFSHFDGDAKATAEKELFDKLGVPADQPPPPAETV